MDHSSIETENILIFHECLMVKSNVMFELIM